MRSPEKGSIVKCEAVEESPGIWAFTPVRDLMAGEYGAFTDQVGGFPLGREATGQAVLFGFGIVK